MNRQHEYEITLRDHNYESHDCSCGSFSSGFTITSMSVQDATKTRSAIATRFAKHVEFEYREAHCDEHPLVHVASPPIRIANGEADIEFPELLTSDDTLSDERFHDECAMRAMEGLATKTDDDVAVMWRYPRTWLENSPQLLKLRDYVKANERNVILMPDDVDCPLRSILDGSTAIAERSFRLADAMTAERKRRRG